jgi:hypothetical protein
VDARTDDTIATSARSSIGDAIRARGHITPINRRRWENFKANRRGYWSLWIFLALFLLSLFAEVIWPPRRPRPTPKAPTTDAGCRAPSSWLAPRP